MEKEDKDKVMSYLYTHPSINSLYKINSGYDFMFEIICRNVKELEEFMEDLENSFRIAERNVYYVVEDIKREEFMAD